MRETRKLAAILVADIGGYCRLASKNGIVVLARLTRTPRRFAEGFRPLLGRRAMRLEHQELTGRSIIPLDYARLTDFVVQERINANTSDSVSVN